jgi:hypothetical protein
LPIPLSFQLGPRSLYNFPKWEFCISRLMVFCSTPNKSPICSWVQPSFDRSHALVLSRLLMPRSERVGGAFDGNGRVLSTYCLPPLSVPLALSVSNNIHPFCVRLPGRTLCLSINALMTSMRSWYPAVPYILGLSHHG